MTTKLIVGYTTQIHSEEVFDMLRPEIVASKSCKTDEAIAKDIEERTKAFRANAHNLPYLGTFKSVTIASPTQELIANWDIVGREPGGKKQPICIAVAGWLLKHFPKAWSKEVVTSEKPEVLFIGFNPRLFVKMLALECTLPVHAKPLPPKMWYGTSDYRDIETAILPDDCKPLTLPAVLKRRRPIDEKSAKLWDQQMKSWTAPGVDSKLDVWLVTELAAQLGFLNEE